MTRFFDIFFSICALLVLSPVLITCSIILKLTGEGEIFYRQSRVGIRQKQFELLKFATMLKDSPNIGTGNITVQNDPRVLPFGKFLRKTKINELPQLLNILFGEMSIVGPRPLTPELFDIYSEKEKEIISSVKPGLSGYGSLFFRDEQKYFVDMSAQEAKEFYRDYVQPYKAKLEITYVRDKSLPIYFCVICLTVVCVIFPRATSTLKILTFPTPPSQLQR